MAVERIKNVKPGASQVASPEAGTGKYQQSTIEFPYNDLDDAVEIAQAIASNAGISCTLEQLAAYMKKAISGPFRVRLSNARMFGITKNEKGEVHLTDLGRMIVDPKHAVSARAEAFLSVPLYKAIFERYRRFSLPGKTALEQEIQALGVSSKQTDKARQTFLRSAKQAGFFAHGDDRLVMPAVSTMPLNKLSDPNKNNQSGRKEGNGSNGNGGGPTDALIQALIEKLPPQGPWPSDERVNWLKMLVMGFQVAYGADEEIEIKKKEADG